MQKPPTRPPERLTAFLAKSPARRLTDFMKSDTLSLVIKIQMRGRGKSNTSSSFREPPFGARRCGRYRRHWPLSSRAEQNVLLGPDGILTVIMQARFAPVCGPIVQSGRPVQDGNESGTAGTAKNEFAPVSQRHLPLRGGFCFCKNSPQRRTQPEGGNES